MSSRIVALGGGHGLYATLSAARRLTPQVTPGVTMADELSSVAVHNAYHFGKIVALRQRIGAWPPEAASDAS